MSDPAFRDPDRPLAVRVADLVGRLTLAEKLGLLHQYQAAVPRLRLPPRVLHEYELPAFRAPIEAGAAVALMASYNLVNGRPAHLSPLLNGEARGWTPNELLVVGDAGGVANIAGAQGYLPDHACGY